MAGSTNNTDFIVKNGLQVSANLVVGTYANKPSINQIANGAIISGNVGIGTATVSAGNSLAVYGGNLFVAGNVRLGNTATTMGGIYFPDGTFQNTASTGGGGGGTSVTLSNDTSTNAPRYVSFASATSGTLSTLYTSNSKLLYYPSTGNLAIGGNITVGGPNMSVSGADSALTIWGDGTTLSTGLFANYNSPYGATITLYQTNGNTSGVKSAVVAGDGVGTIWFSGASSASADGQGAFIASVVNENWNDTSTPASLSFGTTPLGEISPFTRMTITSNGNVGIGTATVSAGNSLAVYGGNLFVAGNLQLGNTTTNMGGIMFPDGTFQNTASTGGGTGTSVTLSNDTSTNAPRYVSFASATSGTLSTLYTSAPNLIFYPVTGNLTVGGNIIVNNSGSFGNLSVNNTTVSTSTSSGALVVQGGAGIGGDMYTGGNIVANVATGGSGSISITANSPGVSYTLTNGILTAGLGTIGIGWGISSNRAQYMSMAVASGKNYINTTNRDFYITDGSNNQWFYLTASNGNIGLNSNTQSTSTTTGALTVAGGIGITGNVYASNAYITSNVGIGTSALFNSVFRIYANNSTDAVRIRQDGTGNSLIVSDSANDTSPFVVDANGNVGIGTFPPVFPLDVWGNVRVMNSALIANISVTNTTVSTSTTTGALILPNASAGLGIAGNIYVGGNVYATNATTTTSATLGAIVATGGIATNNNLYVAGATWAGNTSVMNITIATSTATGALVVRGGAGIAGNIYVGGNINVSNTTQATSALTGALVVSGGAGITGNAYISNAVWAGNIAVTNTTVSTSAITGAVTLPNAAAGLGVAGNVYVGGNIYATNATTTTSATLGAIVATGGIATNNNLYVAGATWAGNTSVMNITIATSTATGALVVRGGAGIAGNVYVGGNINVSNTTQATSALTGALVVSGGAGITGNAYISNAVWAGNIAVTNTTASTSTTTGALIVAGGIGVSGNIYAGANVGIGTSSVLFGNAAAIYGGNLFVSGNVRIGNSRVGGSGILFSDGTFQGTAAGAVAGPTGPTGPSGTSTVVSVLNYTPTDAVTTTFSSSPYTSSNSYISVYVDGVWQPPQYYTWSGTNVILTSAAPLGSVVDIQVFASTTFGTATGNTNVTLTSTSDATFYPAFMEATSGNLAVRVDSNMTYVPSTDTLTVGNLLATSKSFMIDHPTNPGMKLRYGSLESPYHGIRLTGKSNIAGNFSTVTLPNYTKDLVDDADVNIQLTNIRHNKTLWVDNIDIANNQFTVGTDWTEIDVQPREFFYSFTAVRKDIPPMETEFYP